MERFVADMTTDNFMDEADAREAWVPRRHVGEDYTVRYRDEDGAWFLQRGRTWTSLIIEAHPFTRAEAEQHAHEFNQGRSCSMRSDGTFVSRAVVIDYPEHGLCKQT
jgi:hypothetical protein